MSKHQLMVTPAASSNYLKCRLWDICFSCSTEQKCNAKRERKSAVTMWADTFNVYGLMAEPRVPSTAQAARDGSHWGKRPQLPRLRHTPFPSPRCRQITHRLSQLITREFRVSMTSTHETCNSHKGTTTPCGRNSRLCKNRFCQLTSLEIVTLQECFGEI